VYRIAPADASSWGGRGSRRPPGRPTGFASSPSLRATVAPRRTALGGGPKDIAMPDVSGYRDVLAGGQQMLATHGHPHPGLLTGGKASWSDCRRHTIDGVHNPCDTLTAAIHVYGRLRQPTTQSVGPWPRQERPFDLAEARQQFADANAAWAADDGA
jgi:hypothetical protein